MGDKKLCLMLILSAAALAHADEELPCSLAQRYKPFHKYEYMYEAESLNFLNGAVNGPKGSCKVEIEVPGACQYILRTTECTLSEVADFDAEGNPTFVPAATADAFKAAMEKNPLKVTVEGDNIIKLFPEDDEPVNILNIKRGMISGFAVPVLEEEKNKKMPTIFGLCKTDYTVNARQDIATDVTLTRDLSRCDHFSPVSDYTSPLALITGLHYPLAQMIRSTQTCNYQFDNAQHHPTGGECIENHILVPFSHKGKFGVTNVSKQKATLLAVTEYSNRAFEPNLENEQTLHPHASIDKSPIQDKDAALALLRELAGLSKTDDGHKRAHLAHRIVSMIRKFSAETLHAGVPEALEISRSLTYQALFQCGTPECNKVIVQMLKTFDSSSVEIDATIYAMGLLPKPSHQLVSDMLEMAKFKKSKPIFYGASNAVKRLYQATGKVTPEIKAVAKFALEQIGDCTGDQDHIFMSLKVIGNMAAAMAASSPALKSAVIQCVNQPRARPEVQLAAIQVYRQTALPEEGRKVLMQVLLDGAAPLQKRVAAYLILMKDPQPSELAQLAAALPNEKNHQVTNFVCSHITNILKSTAPETRGLKQRILEALQGNDVGNYMEEKAFSRNYKAGSLEGNMIFDGASYLPKEVVLDMSLNAFGFDVNMFEVGIETNGIEETSDALFGPDGFFPDITMKSMFFANSMIPTEAVMELADFISRKKRQVPQEFIQQLSRSIQELMRKLESQGPPDAMVYLKLLGLDLGYLKTRDMKRMAKHSMIMLDNLRSYFMRGLLSSTDNDLFAHYIFMDNEFYLPTGPGVPLRVALSGTFTAGIKGGVQLDASMSEVAFMPSAGIEFVTEVGAHFPDFVQSGLEMHTSIYHESGLKAKVSIAPNNFKLTIPAPHSPTRLIRLSNSLVSLHGAQIKAIPTTGERVDATECTSVFAGLKYCTALQYSDALHTNESPYFPFTGDSKLTIDLLPTGEVSEYVLNLDHSFEDSAKMTHIVTSTLTAKGSAASKATITVKFNMQTHRADVDLQIPDYDLEVGLRLGSVNPETKGKATHSVQVDLINKNIPQVSIIALAKLEEMKDFSVAVQALVPPVADFQIATNFHYDKDLALELKTDFQLLAIHSKQNIALKYDEGELTAEIKAELSTDTEKILSELEYIQSLLYQTISQNQMIPDTFIRKSAETVHEFIKKYGAEVRRLPVFSDQSFPDKLYWKAEADAKSSFGRHYYTFAIPLTFDGISSGDFSVSADIPVPHFEVFPPDKVFVSVPVLGKAEASAKVETNFYKLEADVSTVRDQVQHPSYSAKWGVIGICPSDILSLKTHGSALLVATSTNSLKAELKTHVDHKLIDATVTVEEEVTIADTFSLTSNCKLEATNPLGVQVSLEHSGDASFNGGKIYGNGNLRTSLQAGPLYAASTISQTVNISPINPGTKSDLSLKIESAFIASTDNNLPHKSDLDRMILHTPRPTYSPDTGSYDFKLKDSMNADVAIMSHLDFKSSIETKSALLRIILLEASEETMFSNIEVDIKADHNIDVVPAVNGSLSHTIHVLVTPTDVKLELRNNANALIDLADTLSANLCHQNDYSVTWNSGGRRLNNVGLIRLNQDRFVYNITLENNQADIGIYASANGKINLDFLTVPISIPELKVPIINFKTPAVSGINLYEYTGLQKLLTSTDLAVEANGVILWNNLQYYLFSGFFVDSLDLKVSIKSSVVNLHLDGQLSDGSVHFVGTSTSVFESLKAKLELTGTSEGASMYLDNPHIQVTQNYTRGDRFGFGHIDLAAKVDLPIFTAEVNEETKWDASEDKFYNYTYKMVYTVNVPVVNVVGSGGLESSVQYETDWSAFLSRVSSSKEHFDGTILGTGVVKRSFNSLANLRFEGTGLHSTWNVTDVLHINHGDLKIEASVNSALPIDINVYRDSPSEGSILTSWNINANNEINVDNLNTKGKHSFKISFETNITHEGYPDPWAVNAEVDLAQIGFPGDLTNFQRLTVTKNKGEEREIYMYISKIGTPIYKATAVIEMDGPYPTYNGTFRSNGISPLWYLDYNCDGTFTLSIGDEVVNHTVKAFLGLADSDLIILGIQTAVQHLDEGPSHIVNVDITSQTFTDVHIHYAACQDGSNTSIATPSTGLLGFQHQHQSQQRSTRLYCRYASMPDTDVDILVFKAARTDNEMLLLQASANMEAPAVILSGLYDRVPAITSSLHSFAEKYDKVGSTLSSLKSMILSVAEEISESVSRYSPELSQLSIFFRYVVVQAYKALQAALDGAIKFLRETQLFPGMHEITLHKITTNVGSVLEQLLQTIAENLSAYLTPVLDTVSSIQVTMPSGEVLSGSQIIDQLKGLLNSVMDMVKNMESVDVMLEKLGKALQEAVNTAQGFVDSVNSDILDSFCVYINAFYSNLVLLCKWATEQISNQLNTQGIDNTIRFALESAKDCVIEIINLIAHFLPGTGAIALNDGTLDVELHIPIQQ
ncbi:apolipoprotein B-100-like [Engraulis encrasicolus]|uniref:apolipoprotein B-100-like n=1 Tax=Engraulis encrasicolus TaxID=184585 RepID=UPI002FD62D6A